MKNIIFRAMFKGAWIMKILTVSAAILIISSCKKEANPGLIIQDHDSNKMMSLLHEMLKSMDSLNMTNDPDNDFALMMKVHHEGGAEMAQYEINEGSDSTLQRLAGEIIERQQQDLVTLDSFLVAHSPSVNESGFRSEAERAMEIMGSNADLQIITGKTDHDFATLLIQHHEGAVNLAALELYYGVSEPMKRLAVKIRNQQQEDIREVQDWLLR